MKKILFPLMLLLIISPIVSYGVKPDGSECPNIEMLMKTTEKDKDDLLKALNVIFSGVYGSNLIQWGVEIIQPMASLTGVERNNYKIAMNLCGKEVANTSWFVRLRYHRLFPTGVLYEFYIAKDKNSKWFVWHRNR